MWAITNKDNGYVMHVIENREDVNKYINNFHLYYYIPDFNKDISLLHKYNYLEKNFFLKSWQDIKNTRDQLLTNSDWRELSSYPGDDQEAWRTYRQELRDLPQDYTDVEDIIFPEEP
jgi:hypothetical protein